jgi:hypothetical protein
MKFVIYFIFLSLHFTLFSQIKDNEIAIRNDVSINISFPLGVANLNYERKLFKKSVLWAGTGIAFIPGKNDFGIPIDLTIVPGKNKHHVEIGPFLNVFFNQVPLQSYGFKAGYRFQNNRKRGLILKGGIELFKSNYWDDDYISSDFGLSYYIAIGFSF